MKTKSDPLPPLTQEQLGDYKVENLDPDIQDSMAHLESTEAKLGAKMVLPKPIMPPASKV